MPNSSAPDRSTPSLVRLPASRFPERASIYICDGCGAEVTKHLYPRPAKASPPYGPERYVCVCGRIYRTGAVEWDSLDTKEKRRRVLWPFLGFALGLPAAFVCYLFLTTGARIEVGVALSVIAASVYPAKDALNIVRSIKRTRSRAEAQAGGGIIR